jgi:20S proteasome subunit alpha 2
MELEDVVHTAILTLKEGYEGAMASGNIEIGIAYSEEQLEKGAHVETGKEKMVKVGKFKKLNDAEIKDYLANIA